MKFGGIVSPVDLRDYRFNFLDLLHMKFPAEYEVEMKHNIKKQQAESCTSNATATILEHFDNNRYVLSTSFIYGIKHKLFGDEGTGETVRNALETVKNYGDVKYAFCPGDLEVDEVYELAEKSFNNEKHMKDAYKHKIKSYVRLRSKKSIKYALMNYGPIIVCTKWYNKYTLNKITGNLVFDKKSSIFYHSFVIYGWNDFGWKCQNSWGVGWGKSGLFNIPYDFKLNDIFALIDDKSLDSLTEDVKIIKPGKWNTFVNNVIKLINKIINKTKNMINAWA